MPIMDGMKATRTLRDLCKEGVINLSSTQIFMHSAIQQVVTDDERLFDGICKNNEHVLNLYSEQADFI